MLGWDMHYSSIINITSPRAQKMTVETVEGQY